MKKLLLLLVLLLTWGGGGVTLHAETAVIKATGYTYSDDADVIVDVAASGTVTGVADFKFGGGGFSNTPFRWYSGKNLTITPLEGVSITKVYWNQTVDLGYNKSISLVSGPGSMTMTIGTPTWEGLCTTDKPIVLQPSAQVRTNYITIEYTPAATGPVDYEFPFADNEYSFYVNGSKTLTLDAKHPAITYTWEAANDAANKDKFSVTEADNVITMTGSAADTYTVTASWNEDDTWLAGSATFSAEVKAIEQAAYTFPYSGQTISLEADATQTLDFGDTHPDFTWTKLSGDDVASVDENGVLTAGAAGTCVLQAEWAESQYFTAGNASFTVVVTRKAAGLAFGATEYSAQIGRAFTAPALTNPNNLTVAYTSSVPGVATVDATSGAVTIVGEGTTVITATSAETDKIAAGEASYTLNVTELNEDVEVFKDSAKSWPVRTSSAVHTFTAKSSTTDIEYSIVDGGYYSSSTALWLNKSTGSATFSLPRNLSKILITNAGGSAKVTFDVYANDIKVTSSPVTFGTAIDIPASSQTAGTTYKIAVANSNNAQIASITYYYAAATAYDHTFSDLDLYVGDDPTDVMPEGNVPEGITFSTTSTAITIDGSKITPVAVTPAGEPAQVHVEWPKSAAYTAGSADFNVTVTERTKIDYTFPYDAENKIFECLVEAENVKLDLGEDYPKNMVYVISDEDKNIADIDDETGEVQAYKVGTITVTAMWEADSKYNANEDGVEFTVKVNGRPYTAEFADQVVYEGVEGKFKTPTFEKNPLTFTFASSDDEGLMVDKDGAYLPKTVGNYTVTVTWEGNDYWAASDETNPTTFNVEVKPVLTPEKPVVTFGETTITENSWDVEVVRGTEISIKSENATKLKIWCNDIDMGDPEEFEDGVYTLTIDEAAKYVFAGVNPNGEYGDELVVTFKVYDQSVDYITRSNFTFSGSSTYSLSDTYTSDNNVSYIAFAQKTNTSTISFNTSAAYQNSGVVVTANKDGYVLKQIIVTCTKNEGGVGVFGKATAYTNPTELYDEATRGTEIATIENSDKTTTTTIDVTGEYQYFGINSVSGAANIKDITLVWGNNPTPEQPVADKTVTSLSENETISWTVNEGCVIKVTKLDDYYGATAVTSAPMRAASLTGEVPADDNWTLSEDQRTATYTAPANAEKVSYSIVAVNAAGDESKPFMFDVNDNGGVSGIDAIEANDTEAVEYYNLQGVRVEAENLTPGLYITRKGNNISKVVVR